MGEECKEVEILIRYFRLDKDTRESVPLGKTRTTVCSLNLHLGVMCTYAGYTSQLYLTVLQPCW